jgi:hypothetical protein
MSEWFSQLGYEGQLATWLVASFLLYGLSAQLAWQFQWLFSDRNPLAGTTDQYEGVTESSWGVSGLRRFLEAYVAWAYEAIRFFYYLGLPFLVVVTGILGSDLLGVSGTDWVAGKSVQGFLWEDWARGFGLALAAFLAVMGIWVVGRLIARNATLTPVIRGIPGPPWYLLLNALYDQIHWAFYRSGPILWLDDMYWGTIAGLALVMLELALNPAQWWSLKSPEAAGPALIRLLMAWVSALLFLATGNLWLTTAVHFAVVLMFLEKQSVDYARY